MKLTREVDLKLKKIVEIWLFGFCCGVVVCIAISLFNSSVR